MFVCCRCCLRLSVVCCVLFVVFVCAFVVCGLTFDANGVSHVVRCSAFLVCCFLICVLSGVRCCLLFGVC